MDLNEFRVLIKHCFLMGKNTVQAQQWLEKRYPDSTPSKTTICRWYADFKSEKTSTHEEEESHLSSRQRSMPQVNQNDDQIQRIGLPTASPSSVLAGSGPQRLLALCGSQKDAPGKKIWLE
uniref:Uncharacterized protein n=1 Tax=Anoplophora glabripennis TaxID=217634 RepID=V5GBA7_ANOGL